jgi:two-component system OmpR family sensor kinase
MVLGCYSLVAVPTGTIRTLAMASDPATDAIRILVPCVIVGLLVVALLGLRPPTGWGALGALLGGAGAVAGAGALGTALPMTVHSVASYQLLQIMVTVSGTALALAIAVLEARRRAWALWYVALGFTMIGLAHTGRVSVAVSPVAELGLGFSTIRLGGVMLALWGTVCSAQRALSQLEDERAGREEELRLAGLRLARTAERDHELRSGLAGIAGATTLLGTDRPDAALLGAAVASELSRLDDLLRAPVGVRGQVGTATYAVAPVVSRLVALRRSSGMDLRLDADPDLHAVGSPSTLAQVVTNLIANAARHAPGSPVRICATRRNGRVVIQVRDFGPGVPLGHERAVFEPGVRDGRLGGLGLGLHICHALVSADGGCISIRPTTPDRPGCTAVVELQAAPAAVPT